MLHRCFDSSRVYFQINVDTLWTLEAFPYLGRTIVHNNSDWTMVLQKLRKARRQWGMILKILTKTVETVRACVMVYNLVAQTVLLYGRNIWVVTGAMLNILEGFHHRAAIQIVGMTAKCVAGGMWKYPPVVAALEAAGLYPIQGYIWIRQATIVAQVSCIPIYELCIKADWRPGTSRMM